ncbi:Nse4 C-terminal-domain-containing protein [Lentinula aciculospora]|uniref:Non-structural maintenance of chromosomes element 4 n=1 Tax=Lentinula aciculospora TaxID=153920 RepID=A0A9W9AQW6_9AGAR|nr:Nse4 C-terminal-domain-containing protein [Lentinula aciculospora]
MSGAEISGSDESTLIYNPDQDPEIKRELRRKYRAAQQQLQALDHKGKQCASELSDVLETADILFEQVRDTPEAVLDSDIVLEISSRSAHLARQLKSSTGIFDFDDYLSKLVSFMGGHKLEPESVEHSSDEEEDSELLEPFMWERIGKPALKKIRRVPVVGFMLGPISLEQARKRTKSIRLEKNKADERRPQEITEEDLQGTINETTRNVITIYAILEDIGPTNLFHLIINTTSFSQSVENLFYLSFLIREGKAGLDFAEDGEPLVYDEDSEQPQTRTYVEQPKTRQTVFELDMAIWKRAIEVFEISETLIPYRELSQMRMGGKWYG